MNTIQKFTIFSFLLGLPLQTWAIGEKGNGGDAVAVLESTDPLTGVETYQLYDLDLAEDGIEETAFVDLKKLSAQDCNGVEEYQAHPVGVGLGYCDDPESHTFNLFKTKLRKIEPTTEVLVALTNTFYNIKASSVPFWEGIFQSLKELTWKKVPFQLAKTNDHTTIALEADVVRLATRERETVSVANLGWSKDLVTSKQIYHPYKDVANYAAHITHELLAHITEYQGDETSDRARIANRHLYYGDADAFAFAYKQIFQRDVLIAEDVKARKEANAYLDAKLKSLKAPELERSMFYSELSPEQRIQIRDSLHLRHQILEKISIDPGCQTPQANDLVREIILDRQSEITQRESFLSLFLRL